MLANGKSFTGLKGLKQMLNVNPKIFIGATVSRMMTYALGRPVDPREMPAVRVIVHNAAPGYKFADIVLGIVNSVSFTMNTATGSQQ